ncbi:hypothetical protein SBV42_00400 [Chlamydia crocodili]|uniref:Uncharacterized protein n=1 Tax=Chlamydia crocodili TaxID=2766982 RepID=A0ABX8CDZ5_9CHLA|nr:hypothetical protein [Chlamydia crocodili]QVE49230.1 hypothetical protein H9Q19_00770 [Chlamydia crocodili]
MSILTLPEKTGLFQLDFLDPQISRPSIVAQNMTLVITALLACLGITMIIIGAISSPTLSPIIAIGSILSTFSMLGISLLLAYLCKKTSDQNLKLSIENKQLLTYSRSLSANLEKSIGLHKNTFPQE